MKVRASRRARRLRGLLETIGVVVLLAFWAAPGWVWHGEARFTGTADRGLEERLRKILPRPSRPLWAIDAPGIAEEMARSPGVRHASIHRLAWPARLVIRVDKRRPIACVPLSTGLLGLDGDGVLFPLTSTNSDVPTISGLNRGGPAGRGRGGMVEIAGSGQGPDGPCLCRMAVVACRTDHPRGHPRRTGAQGSGGQARPATGAARRCAGNMA